MPSLRRVMSLLRSSRPRPGARARACIASVLALVLLGPAGCEEQMEPTGPLSGIGVVEGRVLENRQGVVVDVRFTEMSGGDWEDGLRAEFSARADSTGWYRAELPLGLYRIALRVPGGFTAMAAADDTILVGRAVRRRDLERGRVQLTVRAPDAFEGESFRVSLGDRSRSYSRWEPVEDGIAAFDLRLMPLGTYLAALEAGYNAEGFYLPGSRSASGADSLRVGRDGLAVEYDLRARHASISGRVTGTWQDLDAAITVRMLDQRGRWLADVTSDREGRFRFDTLVSEAVTLAAMSNLTTVAFGNGPLPDVLELAPGTHLEGVDLAVGGLRVECEGALRALVDGATMTLVRSDGLVVPLHAGGNPARAGCLAPGTYKLLVGGSCADQPWLTQWYPGVADSAAAQSFAVVAGQWQAVTVQLQPGGAIGGQVLFGDSLPSETVYVYLHDGGGVRLCGNATRASGGAFLREGLPDGDYRLSLVRLGARWWYPGTQDPALAGTITITDGSRVTGLQWTLPAAGNEVAR